MDNDLIFSSAWEIEQVLDHDTVTVAAGSNFSSPTLVVPWPLEVDYIPRVIVSWKQPGDTRWQLNGASNGTYVGQAVLKSDGLYFLLSIGSASVNVRYTIYVGGVQVS